MDYGTAWRILRTPSLTDQIYIEHAFNHDKTFDEIMADWNAAWSDAQAALNVEVK